MHISHFSVHPEKDLTRNKKCPVEMLISFLVSQGSSSTKNELLDFFGMNGHAPTASAFNQQRAKLKADALEAVFKQFNSSVLSMEVSSGYRFLAADGSTFTFFSNPSFASDEYLVSQGHSAKGFYSMHLNAFYDLDKHTYTDSLTQPVHEKDEFRAFCTIVDRHEIIPGTQNVYLGDRGCCSYNNMAHVINKGQYFLSVKATLVRSHSKKIKPSDGYRCFVDQATSFDFIEYGSLDTYEISFRIVCFVLSVSSYECIVTNLPEDEFPPGRIKELYFSRWGIETSFRNRKYTIGLSNFHAYKPEYIKQEI